MGLDISDEEAKEVLSELIDAVIDIELERDLEKTLEKLLYHARKIVDSEAGTLYLKQDDHLSIRVCQNDEVELSSFELNKKILPIDHHSIAGFVILNDKVVLEPDVLAISPECSYHFNASFDKHSGFTTKSILAIPLRHPSEGVIGVLELFNPEDGVFEDWNVGVLKHFSVLASVSLVNLRLYATLKDSYLDTLFRLGLAAEFKDDDTYCHVNRIRYTTRIIARELGCSKVQQEIIFHASSMHDIGKIGVPDSILKKAGKLDDAEWSIMRQHPKMGASILRESDDEIMQASLDIALYHHEKWNGEGYPHALSAEDIPLFARIVAVADVFDALVQERCYKKAWKVSKALGLIRDEQGKHFDPAVVDAFFAGQEDIFKVQEEYGTLYY